METKSINLADFGGPTYIGRDNGEAVRKKLGLDKMDKNNEVSFTIEIPEDTFNINSSFFLGLFGDSIRSCGSKSAFLSKFNFETHGREYSIINKSIDRALRERKGII
ncbi:hypothetical protein [Alcanivorax sp. IL2]|uniref:hypothetical protein n=1 Tax=Alcanivorax sp. IL2 TaxID=3396310 RepID=UPI0039C1833C